MLGDQPYVDYQDPLGFDGIVDDLTELVLASRASTPFTLGIDAGWGMGKSSLMRKLEQNLRRRDDVETVWFNAWTSEGHSVLEGLIKSVLDKIDNNILRRTLRREHLMSGIRVAISLIAGLLRVGNLVDKVWERISVDPRARNQMRELMVSAMDQWMKRGRTPGHRLLVVFIDDLDRCSPGNVFQVFEAVKLYLDTRGFVFVIGFDSTVVSEAILEEKKYSKQVTSRDYLEKITQIGYRIPVPDDKQVEHFIAQCLDSSHTADLFDPSIRSLVSDRNNRNPRKIKRFINMFVLEYGLDRDWAVFGADNLVKILILQLYFPEFARLLQGAAQRDPITEFLDYLDVRDLLRRRVGPTSPEWGEVAAFAESHRLSVDGDQSQSEILALLENELPESYPAAAANDNFVALLRSFPSEEVRTQLREKLAGRYVSTLARVEAAAAPGELSTEVILAGLRVLWYSDNPETDRQWVDVLARQGASVDLVSDYPAAANAVTTSVDAFDVVVSDIGRGGDENAGLRDLTRLREEGLYTGSVVFYTARVTPARREAASKIGAGITSDPAELLALIADLRPHPTVKGAPEKRRLGRKPSVFIDYRREDSAGYAGRLADQLRQALGEEKVFLDIDTIPAGMDFSTALQEAIRKADAYIEVIGPSWLSASDRTGRRRIDDPRDFVRLSLAAALRSSTVVIPVLVSGATLPSRDDLPEDVRPLASRQAMELSDRNWSNDVGRLISVLESLEAGTRKTTAPA